VAVVGATVYAGLVNLLFYRLDKQLLLLCRSIHPPFGYRKRFSDNFRNEAAPFTFSPHSLQLGLFKQSFVGLRGVAMHLLLPAQHAGLVFVP